MGEYINSRQIRLEQSKISCGVLEAHHIPEDVKQASFAICNHLYHKANGRPVAFVMWSDVVRKEQSRGALLAECIKEIPKYGAIYDTEKAINPRTGNPIRVWIWAVNHEATKKWYQDEYMNAIRETSHDEP